MNHSLALEALQQKGKSPFFKALTELYQESFDEVAKLKPITSGGVMMTLKAMQFREKMKVLFLHHMGISLAAVYIEEDPFINQALLWSTTDRFTHQIDKERKTPGEIIAQIRQRYDDKTGRYDLNDGKINDVIFRLILTTGWWTFLQDDGSLLFTADEPAAFTLHEAGHVDHWIRTRYRIYENVLDAAEIINYVGTHPDKETILKLIAAIKKSPYVDRSWNPIIKQVEHYFTTTNSFNDERFHEVLSMLSTLVTGETAAVNLHALAMLEIQRPSSSKQQLGTNVLSLDTERSADEFASRHGAAQSLITALGKATHLDTIDYSKMAAQYLDSSMAIAFFGYLTYFTTMLNVGAEDVSHGYDPLIRRFELIVETAKHAFNDPGLPDEVKYELHHQIITSEAYIRQYRSTNHQRVRSMLKQWKDNVGKFGRIIASPVQNRLVQDYQRLQNATRSLSRHSLFYHLNKP